MGPVKELMEYPDGAAPLVLENMKEEEVATLMGSVPEKNYGLDIRLRMKAVINNGICCGTRPREEILEDNESLYY